jgi:hypothetical protein
MRYLELNPLPNFILGIVDVILLTVVYFKSVGTRPYIRKNGIKVNSILENAKSPVLCYCLIRTGTKRKCYSKKSKSILGGIELFFCKK